MATFPCSLVTPEHVVFEEEVTALMLRTELGDATYLAGHTPLIGAVVPGLVRFEHPDGTVDRVAVHGGFVHVKAEGVTVLAPVAERAEDIDVGRARRALEAAEQAMAEAGAGEDGAGASWQRAETEAARRRAEVRLEVAATD